MRNNPFNILIIIFFLIWVACGPAVKQEKAQVEIKEGLIDIKGADIYYKSMGKGAPLLLVHGGPGLDHSYLLPQMEILTEDYQLIFYDQRACGKSSADVDSNLISIESFVDDIEQIRQALNLEKIHLLGHSWGGMIAINYALTHQEHLNSLILLNPMSPNSELRAKENELLADQQTKEDSLDMAKIMQSQALQEKQSGAYEDLFRIIFRQQFFDRSYADSLTLIFPGSFAQNSQVLQHLGRDLASYDLLPLMPQITIPSLLIYGDYDPLADLAGEKIHEALANSQYKVIKDCGHFPYIEKQEEFVAILNEFVSEVN